MATGLQKSHKIVHDLAKPRQPLLDDPAINKGRNFPGNFTSQLSSGVTDGTFNPFATYDFTGSLRPVYPLSPKRPVPDHIPRPDYADDGRITAVVRHLKTTL